MMSERPRWVEEDRGHASPCWIWQRYIQQHGYGVAWVKGEGRKVVAHRVVYEELVGPVPSGMELDHLCEVRCCVNPAHLRPASHRENTLRGNGVASRNIMKTHCPQGHPYDEQNTRYVEGGRRRCRACLRQQKRARREALRA